jgi:hypothetical protein
MNVEKGPALAGKVALVTGRVISLELSAHGVRVNCLSPGQMTMKVHCRKCSLRHWGAA